LHERDSKRAKHQNIEKNPGGRRLNFAPVAPAKDSILPVKCRSSQASTLIFTACPILILDTWVSLKLATTQRFWASMMLISGCAILTNWPNWTFLSDTIPACGAAGIF